MELLLNPTAALVVCALAMSVLVKAEAVAIPVKVRST